MVDGSDALALKGLYLAIVVDYLGIFSLNWYGIYFHVIICFRSRLFH
jgi:hypothetical protein